MSSKFLKIIFAAVLSVGLVGQGNAALISVGDLRTDAAGDEWSYVGSYNLADGPDWDDADGSCYLLGANQSTCWGDFAKPLSGIEAAELLFVLGAYEVFAISTIIASVNHLAFYDEFAGNVATPKGESIKADTDGDGFYSSIGDSSAYINDRAGSNVINYVFKRIMDVPEPSTLAIFALALCGLGARRLKS